MRRLVRRLTGSGQQDQPANTTQLEENEKRHGEARQFAHLLVGEIKLYNEQKVVEGRRNSDLYDRLRKDIDRSRQMYTKRVSPEVAAEFDYFYDELVNTLAEGNPSRLGFHHPGPSVTADRKKCSRGYDDCDTGINLLL